MSEFKNLTLEVADGIAVLAISRPAALNALNSETLDELNVCLSEIEANDDIKAVILTGGPDKKGNEFKSFVAGADIAEMVNFTAPDPIPDILRFLYGDKSKEIEKSRLEKYKVMVQQNVLF